MTGQPKLHALAQKPRVLGKRKSQNHDNDENVSKIDLKQKKRRSPPSGNRQGLEVEQGINTAIGKMNSRMLADYVDHHTVRFGSDLSLVELEDVRIPGNELRATRRKTQAIPESKIVDRKSNPGYHSVDPTEDP